MKLSLEWQRALTTLFFLSGILIGSFALVLSCSCKGPSSPHVDAEAGVAAVNSTCTFLDGITQDQTVENVCATAEEIAQAVSAIAPLLDRVDAGGGCAPVPGSNVCATPRQRGMMIEQIVRARRWRLLLDGGPR